MVFVRLYVKIKYWKRNAYIHKYNLYEDRVICISGARGHRRQELKRQMERVFAGKMHYRERTLYFHPAAVIRVPKCIDEYLKKIGPKSRNMIRKAEKRGIVCEAMCWNDNLDGVYEVNLSAQSRQGREMDDAYKCYPTPVNVIEDLGFRVQHLGAWIEKRLVGYAELYHYGNLSMINRILGHKDYLGWGTMNLIIKECVANCAVSEESRYLCYLTMFNTKTNTLSAFKKRAGFTEFSINAL